MLRSFRKSIRSVLVMVVTSLCGSVAVAQSVIYFPDPDLEALVREAIGLPRGFIFQSHLLGGVLVELDASDSSISNLGGLQYAVELEALDLSGNSVRNIDPLQSLTNLRVLDLSDNRVNNVAALQTLRHIEELDLADNDLTTVEPLLPNTGLGAGDTLDLRGNQLNSRNLCGVLPTFATRGVTVFAEGACTGNEEPGPVDQQPDLFGILRVEDPNMNDDDDVACGSVEVYQDDTLIATTVTDSGGYFYVEGLQTGEIYDINFHAQGYEDVALENVILPAGGHQVFPPLFQVPSEPVISGTILLTVFDPEEPRPPVAGALVRVFQFNVEVARTVTCSSGYFEFDDDRIPFPGAAELRFSAEDFVPEPLTVLLPALDLAIGLEKITFPNSIVGVVVDGLTGLPLEGAQVLVQPTLGLVTFTRVTGADGAYAVENVDDGEYSAHATATGFDAITRFGVIQQDLLQLDLELPREGTQPGTGCAANTTSAKPALDVLMVGAVLVGLLAWRRRSSLHQR